MRQLLGLVNSQRFSRNIDENFWNISRTFFENSSASSKWGMTRVLKDFNVILLYCVVTSVILRMTKAEKYERLQCQQV